MIRIPIALLSAALLSSLAPAQLTLVAPNGYAAVEGNSNNIYPWGRGSSSLRNQFLYDSTTFSAQGVTGPVAISRLRFRADGVFASNWTGGTYPQVRIDLSSSPLDHLAASASFAANHGPDQTTVLNGPVTIVPGSGSNPGPWYIDIPLTTPFVYNPLVGDDLTVDIQLDGTGWTGGTTGYAPFDAVNGFAVVPPLGARVFDDVTNTPNGASGMVEVNYAAVCEFTYAPANGLFPAFSATPTGGTSPLTVQFTDLSYSSAPGGVVSWRWDLDGDGIVDSTAQNPSFVYTGCGDFDVSLTILDGVHPQATRTRSAFVRTDLLQAAFTKTSLGNGVFQFNDATAPAPQAWAWDFDGDNIVDSTVQNPIWAYPQTCSNFTASLTATLNCRSSTTTDTVFVSAASQTAVPFTGGAGYSGNPVVGHLFNVDVTSPDGINVCAITQGIWNYTGPFEVDVYVTPTSYVGKDTNASQWRHVSTGSGTATGGSANAPSRDTALLNQPFYLPAGQFGVAVYLRAVPAGLMFLAATNGAQGPFANADLTINPTPSSAPGIVKWNLFGSGRFGSQAWNGTLHYTSYSLSNSGGYGFFGLGCPGSLGVSRLTANAAPVVNQTLTVTASNAPANAAFSLVGFSNTNSSFGALPLDMTGFGAPGCFGRVSPDAVALLTGSGNQVTWSLAIPNDPGVLGVRFLQQMFLVDAAANTLGLVASDAAAMLIGL